MYTAIKRMKQRPVTCPSLSICRLHPFTCQGFQGSNVDNLSVADWNLSMLEQKQLTSVYIRMVREVQDCSLKIGKNWTHGIANFRQEKDYTTMSKLSNVVIHILIILLMEEIPNNHLRCIKPCKEWDELPTSTGEFTRFLNHQQYVQNITLSTSFSVAAAWVVLFFVVTCSKYRSLDLPAWRREGNQWEKYITAMTVSASMIYYHNTHDTYLFSYWSIV